MPADYESTARALSLPVSSSRSPSPAFFRPPWARSSSHARSGSAYSRRGPKNLMGEAWSNTKKVSRRWITFYESLSLTKKLLLWLLTVVEIVVVVLFLKYHSKIFSVIKPFAVGWKKTTGGWTILWAMLFVTAFPPMVGFSACATLAGFIYGVGEGWLILASATIVGSFCSFIASRLVLRKYVERLVSNDKRFAALTLTMKHDGLKLLCLIRLCPLPYSICNGGMSTFPTVHPLMYALATAIITPKLLIHVFIGSRLSALGEDGDQMSTGAKILNWASIIVTGLVGAFTGWYIYNGTMARARQLEAEEQSNVRQSVTRSGAPPGEFMDDPEAQAAATTLAQGDEVDFFDEDEDATRESYEDEPSDDDVFGQGDGDAEAIDMRRPQRK